MIPSPLYTLTSASGMTTAQRSIPAEQSFYPVILQSDIDVDVVKTREGAVDEYKKAIRERRLDDALDLLDELFVDRTALVRALLETVVELVNNASLPTVLLVLSVTYEAMDATAVLQVTNLLSRAMTRSDDYASFVAKTPATTLKPEGVYSKLSACSPRYWLYPQFVASLPVGKLQPTPVFARLASRLERKQRQLNAMK